MPGFCISGSGFQVALGDTFGGVAWFIGEVRGDQHHHLEHHQADFALGAEDVSEVLVDDCTPWADCVVEAAEECPESAISVSDD